MKIATLASGNGVQTQYIDPNGCEQYIVVGDVDTANTLSGLSVEIDGMPTINILASTQGGQFLNALAKWLNNVTGTVIGLQLALATGYVGKKTKYTFTNNGVTTPDVFAYSEAGNGYPFRATTTNIAPLTPQTFRNFSGLFFAGANVGQLIVKFKGLAPKVMTVIEADALFATKNQTEANGRLDAAITAFDNRDQSIEYVTIVTAVTAGGVNVMPVNFDQADWEQIKAKN